MFNVESVLFIKISRFRRALLYETRSWELAQRRFEMGTINSVELSTFQTNYQNTLIQHFENQYNKLDAYLEIYRMTGNLGLDFIKSGD